MTHPGQAHRDDFIACCLLLAANDDVEAIYRREPTQAELDDPTVAVVDIGGRAEPAFGNFDHHQYDRAAAPCCAITLVLRHLGLEDAARQSLGWLEFSEVIDCRGPAAAAAWAGFPPNSRFHATLSPVEAQILRLFAEDPSAVLPLMQQLGYRWLDYIRQFDDRLQQLPRLVTFSTVGDVLLARVTLDPEDQPLLALEQWLQRREDDGHARVAVTVTRDDRGPGWCLYRRNDAPGVDFSQLDGHPLVTFVHKGGFVAKTVALSGEDACGLVGLALIGGPNAALPVV